MGTWDENGSRVADETRTTLALEDADVDIKIGQKIILAAVIVQTAHNPDTDSFDLEWVNTTDGGAWTTLAAAGQLKFTVGTVLVNGTKPVGGKLCADVDEVDGEEIEDGVSGNITGNQNQSFECQWGIDTADALDGKLYEFRVHSVGDDKEYALAAGINAKIHRVAIVHH